MFVLAIRQRVLCLLVSDGLWSNDLISSTPLHPDNLFVKSLSFGIDLLLVQRFSTLVAIVIRRWCLLLISVQRLISSLARGASVLHPQKHNGLANQHSNSRSSHAESDTDQDGYKDNLEGSPKKHSHTVDEALVFVMVAIAERPEVDMGGKLHGAIWKAVRHSMLAWALVVMGVGLVFVPGKLVEALHT